MSCTPAVVAVVAATYTGTNGGAYGVFTGAATEIPQTSMRVRRRSPRIRIAAAGAATNPAPGDHADRWAITRTRYGAMPLVRTETVTAGSVARASVRCR